MPEDLSDTHVDVWECALGFVDSQVLFTAEDLGVFDCLADGPAPARQVAEAVNIPRESAERLLTMLCALGLCEKRDDGRFANSDESSEKLVSSSPHYIGSMFHHLKEVLYPAWDNFEEILRQYGSKNGAPPGPPSEDVYSDEKSLRQFMQGMHSISYEAAREFAEHAPELENATRAIDLGGATGAFLIALTQQFPELRGTVMDLPQVRPIAEGYFEEYDLSDRLDFHGGSFFEDPIPQGADLYALGFILHDWDREAGSHLLEKIASAIEPNGWLIIGEYLLNEEKTGPLYVARSDLNMMIAARGRERTAGEYRDWISEFGFELERIQRTSGGKNYLMARWRP